MTDCDYEKYSKVTAQAKAAIKGEAFFEALVADYSLPHHIVGLKDVGVDYICEWVYGDRPTGILYAVQVKTFSALNVKPKYIGQDTKLNKLEEYSIIHSKLVIHEKTLQYWRGFGMPIYLFVIIYSKLPDQSGKLDCFYKRFTEVLTTEKTQEDQNFYKVNQGNTFLAFADRESKKYGFARDLFIDHLRCSYYKGSISYMNPRTIGLEQFPEEAVYGALFEDYSEKILTTHAKTKEYLDLIFVGQAEPSAAADEEEAD